MEKKWRFKVGDLIAPYPKSRVSFAVVVGYIESPLSPLSYQLQVLGGEEETPSASNDKEWCHAVMSFAGPITVEERDA